MFKNMKIGLRLGVGFGLVMVIFLLAVGISYWYLNISANKARQVSVETVPFLARAYELDVNAVKVSEALTDVAATRSMDGLKEAETAARTFREDLEKFKEMFRREKDAGALKDAEELETVFNRFYEDGKRMARVFAAGGVGVGNKLMEDFDKVRENMLEKVEKIQKAHLEEANANSQEVVKSVSNVQRVLFLMGLFSIIFGAVIAVFITRSIVIPLSSAVHVSDTLAEGDLTAVITVDSRDETGMLLLSMQNMVKKLKSVLYQNKEASRQVSVAADQIATANQGFSEKITQQASTIEETSATMEEMSASIKQTADNAKEANKLAQATKTIAEAGSTVMHDTIKAMDEINRSSGKIANISNVIEEIAFQTNLLALNAAVEAARAGEHGKGFAVVASEIRNLAQRASQSAKEITGLIEDSVDKTGKGVQLAEELSKKLEEISTGIKRVTDLMDEVASAAQEQALGTEQMTNAMAQIDQTTQQNASLVEETSSAAEELAAEAKELNDLVSFFKTDGTSELSAPGSGSTGAERAAQLRTPASEKKALSRTHKKMPVAEKIGAVAKEIKTNGGFEEF